MKLSEWFKQFFLDEDRMDTSTAFKVLGLEHGDYDGVDKAYKKAALQNHPDRGGSEEKMKEINQAKDAVGGKKGSSVGGAREPRKDWRDWQRGETDAERNEINAKRHAKAKVITEYIFKNINSLVEDFIPKLHEYIEKHTGKKFELTYNSKKADNTKKEDGDYSYNPHNFDGHVSWGISLESSGEDGLTKYVIILRATIDENTFEKALSVEQLDINLGFETFAYNDGKKTKMQQKTWGNSAKTASLGKPEDFFPVKKITKMGTTEKTRLTKRADAFSFIKTEMKAEFPFTDRDIALIPVGGDIYVRVRRQIWMRVASWSFSDLVEKKNEYSYKSLSLQGKILSKLMTGKDALNGQGDGTGSNNVMEQMPDFGKIVREVVALIKKEKYRDAGDLLSAKGKEYDEVIAPKIKDKTLK